MFTLAGVERLRGAAFPPGLAAGLGLVLLALQTWWLATLRVDPAPLWQGIRLDLWGAWAFFGVAILALIFSFRRKVIQ